MLFSSMTFVFLFLPIVCAVYFLVRKDLRNYVLLLASILFYAWGEPRYLAIMILTILINYLGALAITRLDTDKTQKYRKMALGGIVVLNLSFLFYFKYFNFFIDNLNAAFTSNFDVIDVIMPIGISFYTFQAISYVIDVYRREVPVQKDVYKLALYICLFPQLIAGPIVKYYTVADQIEQRSVTFNKVSYGIKRFIIGLVKKMLIANTMGAVADSIFSQPVNAFNTSTAWLGAIAYSFQLFYDFSGYSDMAIGLGSMFGFKFLENFNYPYISKSITEFWRRWHISLSTWFKEYLYIPLGGNRVAPWRMYANLFIVFLATGVWHGASWTFIVWGLFHGAFIIFEKATGWHKKTGGVVLSALQHIYCILAFVIGWVFFRADNLPYAIDYLKNMFGLLQGHNILYATAYYLDNIKLIALLAAFLCSMPLFTKILDISNKHKLAKSMLNLWLLILFILSAASIASSTYNPFIYFRF